LTSNSQRAKASAQKNAGNSASPSWGSIIAQISVAALGAGGVWGLGKVLCEKGFSMQAVYLGWGALGTLVLMVVVFGVGTVGSMISSAKSKRSAKREGKEFVALPIQHGVDKLKEHVASIHDLACRYLFNMFPDRGIDGDLIRVNVFFPQYEECLQGSGLHLAMSSDLHVNMNYAPERRVRFATGEGATGIAYSSGKWYSAVCNGDRSIWTSGEEVCKLNPDQANSIHRDLCWVVSYPLLDRKAGSILAVINIDGLSKLCSEEESFQMIYALQSELTGLEARITKLPRVKLALFDKEKRR
jgi:hypothetical protein